MNLYFPISKTSRREVFKCKEINADIAKHVKVLSDSNQNITQFEKNVYRGEKTGIIVANSLSRKDRKDVKSVVEDLISKNCKISTTTV